MNLTPRQLDVIVAIRNYRHLHGYSPTMQELADQLGTSKVTIFEHVGALETLGETYRSIHEVGLPQAGLKPLEDGLDMEVYDDRVFNDFSPESILYLYVPVK